MRLKDKLKTKGFWVRIVSAVIVILQAFGLKLDAPAVNEILTAVVGLLVIFGIVSDPSSGSGYLDGAPDADPPDPDRDENA